MTPLLACVALLHASCVSGYRGPAVDTSPRELQAECGPTAIHDVELVEQQGRDDCGAAALAMVLSYWQIETCCDDVRAACPPEPGVGITAKALRDHSRELGLPAYLVHGELADLEHEIGCGRPVLVGLAQLYSDLAYTHYAVVVGINLPNDRVVTLDPARGWQKYTVRGFLDEWEPIGRPAMVFLGPSTTASARSRTVNSSENDP